MFPSNSNIYLFISILLVIHLLVLIIFIKIFFLGCSVHCFHSFHVKFRYEYPHLLQGGWIAVVWTLLPEQYRETRHSKAAVTLAHVSFSISGSRKNSYLGIRN